MTLKSSFAKSICSPSIRSSPASGVNIQPRRLISVVFPQPLSPITITSSLSSIRISTALTATTAASPVPNRFVRPIPSTTAAIYISPRKAIIGSTSIAFRAAKYPLPQHTMKLIHATMIDSTKLIATKIGAAAAKT